MKTFGQYIRNIREEKFSQDKNFSLRKVAQRIQVEPSYLSKIERGDEKPSEKLIKSLAQELHLDENVLLAMEGKISQELQNIILKNPIIFAQLLQVLENSPEDALLRIVQEVKDGNW